METLIKAAEADDVKVAFETIGVTEDRILELVQDLGDDTDWCDVKYPNLLAFIGHDIKKATLKYIVWIWFSGVSVSIQWPLTTKRRRELIEYAERDTEAYYKLCPKVDERKWKLMVVAGLKYIRHN